MYRSLPLTSLSLAAFRGACEPFELKFEKDKKLTLIYGENGSGKTTICDALEFLARLSAGSLDAKGMGSRLEQYYFSAGKSATDLSVVLKAEQVICTGRLDGKKVSVDPEEARPAVEILRQRQIAELVEAQPAKRYDAIRHFINIDAFELSEKNLSDQIKSLKAEETSAKQAENQSLDTLQNFFTTDGSPAGLTPIIWAEKRVNAGSKVEPDDLVALVTLIRSYDRLTALSTGFKEHLGRDAAASRLLADKSREFNEVTSAAGAGAGELYEILTAAQKFLHSHEEIEECPLCTSREYAQQLFDSVPRRLYQLEAVGVARQAMADAEKQVERAAHDVEGTRRVFAVIGDGYKRALGPIRWQGDLKPPEFSLPERIDDLEGWLTGTKPTVEAWRSSYTAWNEDAKYLETLAAERVRYMENLRRRMELQALIPNLERALEICVDERRKFTDGILSAISKQVGKLYEMVHPGEGLEKISLPLDPDKRASLELRAEFAGKDTLPQAYFSQSHLDTLGLCIFLALALRDKPEEKILILDDVLGSVDEPHVDRVIGMIYEVAKRFRHTIVTTHYRPWKEKYRWGCLRPEQPFQFIELRRWSLAKGVSFGDITPEIVFLKEYLAAEPVDYQAVCSKAGVILEAILDYIVQKYECSIPRKREHRYTLGELLPSINGKLRSSLCVAIMDAGAEQSRHDLKPLFDAISDIVQVRNAMGAHFNEIAHHLQDDDALKFARNVEQLHDLLVHPDHGWPNNDKSGSYWRNTGDSRRLYPLKKPS